MSTLSAVPGNKAVTETKSVADVFYNVYVTLVVYGDNVGVVRRAFQLVILTKCCGLWCSTGVSPAGVNFYRSTGFLYKPRGAAPRRVAPRSFAPLFGRRRRPSSSLSLLLLVASLFLAQSSVVPLLITRPPCMHFACSIPQQNLSILGFSTNFPPPTALS